MAFNYILKYRTFNQLLADVSIDFANYDLESMIEPQQLIKVAKRVNYDLGLRIHQTDEQVLELENGRVMLPTNFYTLNFALICGDYTVTNPVPQGTFIDERPYIPEYKETDPIIKPCVPETINCRKCNSIDCTCGVAEVPPYSKEQPYGNYCIKPRVFLNCKGDAYELTQVVRTETRTYKMLAPIRMLQNNQSINCDCPNIHWNVDHVGWIKDNYFYSNYKCGKIYINYEGMLENDEGDILVPDHDLLNEYYEYALKQRILENLVMNDETAIQKLQLIEQRLRAAKYQALSLVNTPNFAEMKQVWAMNRRAQYAKYYDMFRSYPTYNLIGSNKFR